MADPSTLTALSPLDGRYDKKAAPLRPYLSEFALIRYRVLIEVRWLQHLADEPTIADLRALESPVKDVLNQIVDNFSLDDAKQVKALESRDESRRQGGRVLLAAAARRACPALPAT